MTGRRHSIAKYCPQCAELPKPRQSIVEVQMCGRNEWLMTCSDYSICNFSKPVVGYFGNEGLFVEIGLIGETMLITSTRKYKTEDGIFGVMDIDTNSFKSATTENLKLCIPVGVYDVLFMWSDHFQQIMPHIMVPDRIAIEIHWANWPKQLEGCIALGQDKDKTDNMITESKAEWIEFVKAISDQPSIKIKIVEDYGHV